MELKTENGRVAFVVALLFFSSWICHATSQAIQTSPCKDVVLYIGAHPDDLEAVAGLAFRMKDDYDFRVADFTRGEGGCGPAGFHDGSTGLKRMAEERQACAMLGCEPVFLCQTNFQGRLAFADRQVTEEIEALIWQLKPKAIITHWPVDTHPDHVQCSAAVQHAVFNLRRDRGFTTELYFNDQPPWQTKNFRPTYYVDVTAVETQALALVHCYVCQNGAKIARNKAERMRERGAESPVPVTCAETFTTFTGDPLPGGILERYAVKAYRCRDEGQSVLRTVLTARDELLAQMKANPNRQLTICGLPCAADGTNRAECVRAMRINQSLYAWMRRMAYPNVRMTGYDPAFLASVDPEEVKPIIKDHWIAQTYSKGAKNWKPDNRLAEKLDLVERARGETFDLVMSGDSITHMWDWSNGTNEWAKLSAGRKTLNLGFGGDGMQHTLWNIRYSGLYDGWKAKAIALLIGTNNRNESAETVAEGIRLCIAALREKHPESKILLQPIIGRLKPEQRELRVKNERVNDLIRPFADGQTVIWTELRPIYAGYETMTPAEQKALFFDGTHPGPAGFAGWRAVLERTLDF